MFEHGRVSVAAVSFSPATSDTAFDSADARVGDVAREPGNGSNASRVAELQARIRGMQATTLDSPALPTTEAIAAVLPGGAIRQGAAYSVDGSMTLAMAMLAGPSASGAWCGVVGVPDFGAE